MPAQTKTKKAILLWPLTSSQKITGTDMTRAERDEVRDVDVQDRTGAIVADDGAARAR